MNRELRQKLLRAAYYMTQYAAYMTDEGVYETLIEAVEDWEDSDIETLIEIFEIAPEVPDKINQILYDNMYTMGDAALPDVLDFYLDITSDDNNMWWAMFYADNDGIDDLGELMEKTKDKDAWVIFVDSETDLAYEIIDEMGWEGIQTENYFDYERFGRDLVLYDSYIEDSIRDVLYGYDEDFIEDIIDNQAIPEGVEFKDGYDREAVENYLSMYDMGHADVAEDFISGLGSPTELGKNALETYFDYEAYGRDLSFDFDEYEFRNITGYVHIGR